MVTQEEDCLKVKCGESGCAEGEELRNSYMVVSSEAMGCVARFASKETVFRGELAVDVVPVHSPSVGQSVL